jgi:hypothetical protein
MWLLILSLPACGTIDPVIDNTHEICAGLAVVPSVEATADELAAVDEALALWHAAGVTGLVVGDAPDLPTVLIRFQDAAPLFNGVYDDEAGVIYVNHRLSDSRERAVTVAHELGHVFGLVHVSAAVRLSVMNPNNLTVPPTRDDWLAAMSLGASCVLDAQ